MVARAVEHGGGLEAVVHAAGNMCRGALEDLDEQALHDVFASNTIGPMMLTALALPHLRERSGAVGDGEHAAGRPLGRDQVFDGLGDLGRGARPAERVTAASASASPTPDASSR